MSSPFTRSLRSLEADRFRPQALWLAMGAVLLVAWCAWFFGAEIPLYESTSLGRVEAVRAVHSVDSPLSGRVVRSFLDLGRPVRAGEVLIELESESVVLEAAQRRAEKTMVEEEIERLREEIAAEERSLLVTRRRGRAEIAEAQARREELLPKLELQQRRVEAIRNMPEGLLSDLEIAERAAEVEETRRVARTLAITVERLESTTELELQSHQARIADLRREIAGLQGELEVAEAALARLGYEIERRRVRAPRPGLLGDVRNLQPGAHVAGGERLAVVVADGDLRVVAKFAPDVAVGTIRPGQRAQLRLAAYPWTQYGTVPATVHSLGTESGSEPDGVEVRVELRIPSEGHDVVPLQHGLSTEVDVEVARLSPAQLLLRSIGASLQRRPRAEQLPSPAKDAQVAERGLGG